MKRTLAVIGLTAVAWLAVRTHEAHAAPPCSPQNELLNLFDATATYNNQPTVVTASGRYASDAGVEFYVSFSGSVLAQPFDSAACGAGARQVTLRLTDPWTGEMLTTSLGEAP